MRSQRDRRFSRLVLTVIYALFLSPNGVAQNPVDEVKRETLAPGIEHREIVRVRSLSTGSNERWLINLLEVDPGRAKLDLALALDEIVGQEMTSSLAQRYGAIAAINGGYFRTSGIVRGEPAGLFFRGDKLLSEAVPDRAGLSVTFEKGVIRAKVSRMTSRAEVRVSNSSRRIDGINRPRESDELILYTPEFHRTTLTKPDGIEVVAVAGRVVSIITGGSQVIPRNGYVLSAAGEARTWIERNIWLGRRLATSMTTESIPPIPFKAGFSLGGGPQLLSLGRPPDGKDFVSFSDSLIQLRHPRTAVGIRGDGRLLFVTVDGRQPLVSVGMTITELTELMIEFGCQEAINLDGGGSTTMVIRGKVVNRPSDQTGERPVSDALLIFAHR